MFFNFIFVAPTQPPAPALAATPTHLPSINQSDHVIRNKSNRYQRPAAPYDRVPVQSQAVPSTEFTDPQMIQQQRYYQQFLNSQMHQHQAMQASMAAKQKEKKVKKKKPKVSPTFYADLIQQISSTNIFLGDPIYKTRSSGKQHSVLLALGPKHFQTKEPLSTLEEAKEYVSKLAFDYIISLNAQESVDSINAVSIPSNIELPAEKEEGETSSSEEDENDVDDFIPFS